MTYYVQYITHDNCKTNMVRKIFSICLHINYKEIKIVSYHKFKIRLKEKRVQRGIKYQQLTIPIWLIDCTSTKSRPITTFIVIFLKFKTEIPKSIVVVKLHLLQNFFCLFFF